MTISVPLSSKYSTKNLQFVEHSKVWSNWAKEAVQQIHLGKGYSNLPAGVDAGSFNKEVGGNFVWV